MHRSWMGSVIFSVVLLLLNGVALGEPDLQVVRQRWASLLEQEPQLLAPKRFVQAQRAMQELEDAAAKERGVEKRFNKARKRLGILEEAIRKAADTWSTVLDLRQRALRSGAADLAAATFQRAENILLSAAKKLETGRDAAAKEQAKSVGSLYTQAWQQSIRVKLVGESFRRLAIAEENEATQFAPRSYTRALDAVKHVEKLMKDLPQNDPRLLEASASAKDAVDHHVYLLRNLQSTCLVETRPQLESLIVEWEDALARVLDLHGLQGDFSAGMLVSLESVKGSTQQLLLQKAELERHLKDRESQVDSLEAVIDALKVNVEEFQGQVAVLSPFEQEAKVLRKIQSRFSQNEGRVLIENQDIILRLHGLAFESGESTIPENAYSLLDKVVQTVLDVPGAFLIIEGHTDSKGTEEKNKLLSEERANTIRDYLIENVLEDPTRVNSVGYGSSRPVSSNATEEGRALNRRIEITISRAG